MRIAMHAVKIGVASATRALPALGAVKKQLKHLASLIRAIFDRSSIAKSSTYQPIRLRFRSIVAIGHRREAVVLTELRARIAQLVS
jgi:hypothetical protein